MLTFLFWNINRKPLAGLVATLADQHKVDVLILAESGIRPALLLERLNQSPHASYQFQWSLTKGISIFTRFSGNFIRPVFDQDADEDDTPRLTIRRLALPACPEILLAVTHLPSKLYWDEDSQAHECTDVARTIAEAERRAGHSRTVLAGDFNMNPFEKGVVGANGLHAVMTRKLASRAKRSVQGREYPFFYNPMWNHLGERRDGPPGTYYYERAVHVCYFWNTFDQVMVRPDLLPFFPPGDVRVLDRAGDFPLLGDDGRPDRRAASDHLPIVFKLDL